MNVFIIPSWYPSKANPTAGVFFKEQASAIAACSKDTTVGISLWGQNEADLAINRQIVPSLKALFNYVFCDKSTQSRQLKQNLREFYTPTLCFPNRLVSGNIAGIVKANQANFKAFEKEVGKVDLIHAHVSFPAGYAAMALAQQYQIPYIITEHMGPFPFKEFLTSSGELKPALAMPLQRASKVIAVSPKLADDMARFGVNTPVFIPNVIDEDFFTPSPTTDPSGVFKFFTLALLSPQKGIDDLLQAIKKVVDQNNRVHFTIGGGGDLLAHYRALAKTLEVENHITWLGAITREEARSQYRQCHAFVLPSHGETFGVVYAEAIATGKPVIATPCGGPNCIVNESNGLFAAIGDPEDLANQMLYMMEHYAAYDAREIRKGFEQRFSKRAVIPQLLELYDDVSQLPVAALPSTKQQNNNTK
jgi:glycosyltransferase involved in cell wall biosynthesis